MPAKLTYRTRQQEELLNYLRSTPGHHTAAQIHEHFYQSGRSIGTATIYRQLERFVSDGLVRKYTLDTGDGACYEYAAQSGQCSSHFHCKCEKCGRLIHLDCKELQRIKDHLLQEHGFVWDFGRTTFYGICAQCRDE